MNIETALYTIGAKIRTGKYNKDGDLPASKCNPYLVYLDCGYANAADMREIGIAYQTIADHLDELNKDLK
jgi:hypothetical protein